MAKKKKRDTEDEEETGTNSAVMEALVELDDDEWNDTEDAFEDLPEGTYQCKIQGASVVLSKSKGQLQIKWELEVLTPKKYAGRKIYKYRGLVDPEQRQWAKTELAKLGLEWPKKKKLPSVLSDLEGTFCEIKLVESGGDSPFRNFVRAIDEDDVEDNDDDDSSEDETPVKKRKKKAKDEDDDAGDDDEDDEPKKKKKSKKQKEDEEDEDEEDEDEDDEPKKKKKKKVDDDEDDEEEDDDEDDEPKKKKKKKKGDDDDEDDEEDEDEDDAKDDDEDNEVVCKFKKGDLDKDDLKRLKKFAKAAGIDPEDYDDMIDLFGDVAEEVGVSGTFKTPEKLFDAMDEAK